MLTSIGIAIIVGLLIAGIFILYTKKEEPKRSLNDPSIVEYEHPIIDDE